MSTPQSFTVRAVREKNKIRLRTEGLKLALYVTCPRDWRELCAKGAMLTIRGHVRTTGDCVVMLPMFPATQGKGAKHA